MDLGVREWMIIIGVLLIVAVVLDGYRRVRNERRGRIRVAVSRHVKRAAKRSEPVVDDDPVLENPELPNGGARPAPRSGRRTVPVLMDPIEVHEPPVTHTQSSTGTMSDQPPEMSSQWDEEEDLSRYDSEPPEVVTGSGRSERPAANTWQDDPVEPLAEEPWQEPAAIAEPAPEPEPNLQPVIADEDYPARRAEETRHREVNEQLPAQPEEILVLYVLSKEKSGFKGQDLLQLLLACDVRYGKNNIFHRYEEAKGRGAVQFSVANLLEPGTFDLDRMDQLVTPGLCFFMTLPGPTKSLTAFNYMVETAQVLVKNLGGELRDEAQSVVTAQTLEHSRQRIRDFERRQLTLHL